MVCKWGLLDSQVYSDEEGNWFRKVAGGSMAIVIGFEEMWFSLVDGKLCRCMKVLIWYRCFMRPKRGWNDNSSGGFLS